MIDENRLITLENFPMPQLNRVRTVRIYLPRSYKDESKTFPVLYMHDGQNLFFDKMSYSGLSWKACETLDELEDKNESNGIILVAIDNSLLRNGMSRLDEYSPWEKNYMEGRIEKNWRSDEKFGGEGELYADFITKTLKNYIDNNYKTKPERENTFIGGSSMGALISLYIGFKFPEKFSKLALVSPAYWFALEDLKKYISKVEMIETITVYMDMGTCETSDSNNLDFPNIYLDSVKEIEKVLKDKVKKMKFKIFAEHEHSEKYWALRFPNIIKFLLEVE